jgi:TRAP-type C4-dicarboxylate transport system substrate-binding protein
MRKQKAIGMKRLPHVFVALFVVSALLSMPAVGTALAAENKPVNLKIVTHIPPAYGDVWYPLQRMTNYINKFGKEYNLHAEFYHSGSVYKSKEILPAVTKGLIDIVGILAISYIEGSLPSLGASALPFVWNNPLTHIEGTKKGSPYFNYVDRQFQTMGLKLLGLTCGGPQEWICRKPIRKLEDFKGVKFRVAGATYAKAAQALGAVPVRMPSGEIYTSLQRGVVDGALVPDLTISSRKLFEIAKYQINAGCFTQELPCYINKAKYDSLTKDQQKVIQNAGVLWARDEGLSEGFGLYMGMRYTAEHQHGVEQIYLPASEVERMKKAMEPVIEWWKNKVGEKLANEALTAIRDSQGKSLPRWGKIDSLILPE